MKQLLGPTTETPNKLKKIITLASEFAKFWWLLHLIIVIIIIILVMFSHSQQAFLFKTYSFSAEGSQT